jgi:cysteine desulfurase family protein (TIGR01976 family)
VFDINQVRSQFASLAQGFVFLDAPGGTQVPDSVGAAVAQNYRDASGNIGFPYQTSQRIAALVDEGRERSAAFLGCAVDEIIFGANMTSLNFTLSRTIGRGLSPGDEILVTRLDHDANVAPWLELARDRDLVVHEVDIRDDTTLDLDDLERLLGPKTKIVALPLASNAVGTTVDIARVASMVHAAGALVWVDAVQYAPHLPIDVRALDADVLLCSSYKFCGPHLGIAYGRKELLESWRPYKARPVGNDPVGHRFETGTLPYELLAALVATYDYLESIGGIDEVAAWERSLGERLLAGLPEGAKLYGSPTMDNRVPTFLVNFEGVSSSDLSVALGKEGFGVWSGDNYYALGLYERVAWGTALRVGLAHYNTPDEIDQFNDVLAVLVKEGGARRS